MQFEWNEEKRQKNLDKHGVDYGEVRFASLGMVDDVPYVVIHTERDGNIRLISAWKGGRKEYERYKNSFP